MISRGTHEKSSFSGNGGCVGVNQPAPGGQVGIVDFKLTEEEERLANELKVPEVDYRLFLEAARHGVYDID